MEDASAKSGEVGLPTCTGREIQTPTKSNRSEAPLQRLHVVGSAVVLALQKSESWSVLGISAATPAHAIT